MVKAGSPPRYTPPRRITLERCRSCRWSVTEEVSLGEKDISPVAVPSTFLAIAELSGGTAEFPLPAGPRGRALLKLLVLGAMVFLFRGIFCCLPRRLDIDLALCYGAISGGYQVKALNRLFCIIITKR